MATAVRKAGFVPTIAQQTQQTAALVRFLGAGYRAVLSDFWAFRAALKQTNPAQLLRALGRQPEADPRCQLEKLWLENQLPHFDEERLILSGLPADTRTQLQAAAFQVMRPSIRLQQFLHGGLRVESVVSVGDNEAGQEMAGEAGVASLEAEEV